MCMGDGGSNKAEKEAKKATKAAAAAEAKRKADIETGRQTIDTEFAKFDDPYFQQVGDAYNDYYVPQLDDQFEEARKQLIYDFARRGNLASSAYGDKSADVATERDRQKVRIGSQAQDRISQAKSDVEQNRSDLYALNQAAADPEAIRSATASRAASIQPTQGLSPLENVFSGFLNNPATSMAAYQYAANRPISPTIFNPGKSVRTVS